MAFKFVEERENFKWLTTVSGVPVGNVLQLGTGCWLTVCPLCGMAHDVTAISGDEYQPKCELRTTHLTVLANWQRQYPGAAQCTTVYLRREVLIAADLEQSLFAERRVVIMNSHPEAYPAIQRDTQFLVKEQDYVAIR